MAATVLQKFDPKKIKIKAAKFLKPLPSIVEPKKKQRTPNLISKQREIVFVINKVNSKIMNSRSNAFNQVLSFAEVVSRAR